MLFILRSMEESLSVVKRHNDQCQVSSIAGVASMYAYMYNALAQWPACSRVRCSHMSGWRIVYQRNERKRVANEGQNLPSFPVIDKLT